MGVNRRRFRECGAIVESDDSSMRLASFWSDDAMQLSFLDTQVERDVLRAYTTREDERSLILSNKSTSMRLDELSDRERSFLAF